MSQFSQRPVRFMGSVGRWAGSPSGPTPCGRRKGTPAAMPYSPDDVVYAALTADAKRFLAKREVVEVNGKLLGDGPATSQPVNDLGPVLIPFWFRAACRTRSDAR